MVVNERLLEKVRECFPRAWEGYEEVVRWLSRFQQYADYLLYFPRNSFRTYLKVLRLFYQSTEDYSAELSARRVQHFYQLLKNRRNGMADDLGRHRTGYVKTCLSIVYGLYRKMGAEWPWKDIYPPDLTKSEDFSLSWVDSPASITEFRQLYYGEDLIGRILEAAEKEWDKRIEFTARMLFRFGMRPEELRLIKRNNFNEDFSAIGYRAAKRGVDVLRPVDSELKRFLEFYENWLKSEVYDKIKLKKLRIGLKVIEDYYMLPSVRETLAHKEPRPLSYQGLAYLFSNFLDRHGIRHDFRTFYGFRRWLITLYQMKGAKIPELNRIMGWKPTSTMPLYYFKATPEEIMQREKELHPAFSK